MLGFEGGRLLHHICRCLENLDRLTDGQVEMEEDSLQTELGSGSGSGSGCGWATVRLAIRPTSGPYTGGRFVFRVKLCLSNPHNTPEIKCLNNIYHPNIDPTDDDTNVCLSLIDEWQPNFGLDDIVQGLLYLLHNPNLSDPLSPYFDPDMDEAEFQSNVQRSLRGQQVEGCFFDASVMLSDDQPRGKRLHHDELLQTSMHDKL